MGYYVTLESCDFAIPESFEVLSAIYEMDTKFHDIKRGGSYGPNGQEARWFSWMPEHLTDLKSVKEVFEALSFDCAHEQDDEGNTFVILYGYDNKTGQEDLFLAVVAPYVKDGSYTEWRGEEGERWRYLVHEGRLVVQTSILKWHEPKRYTHFALTTSHEGEGGTNIRYIDPYETADKQLDGTE